ncbi:MAG: YraN family protein [Candidatus Margulisbacteria bacterium]|nr:YraN family protein [Candidatus Margulisiibacteriota bacterium]
MHYSKQTGDKGEEIALDFLVQLGYKILKTKFYSKFGEIDIIAQDRDTIVFIEVKNYKDKSLLSPYSAITAVKKKKIIKTAKYFLTTLKDADVPSRFDVIILENDKLLDHIQGAFFV